MSKRIAAVHRVFKKDSALSVENIEFLFETVQRLEGSVMALQKKLSTCRNLSEQKDAMIAARDRSIVKAHNYIELLKEQRRDAHLESLERGEG